MRLNSVLLVTLAAAIVTSGCSYHVVRGNKAELAAISSPGAAAELGALSQSTEFNALTDDAIDCISASEDLKTALRRYKEVPSNELENLNAIRNRIPDVAEKCKYRCGNVAQAPDALPRDRKIGAERLAPCAEALEDHGLELIVADRMLSDAEASLQKDEEMWGNMKLESAEYALAGWTSGQRSATGRRAELRERAAAVRTRFAAILGKVRSYLEDPEVGLIALRLRQRGEGNPTLPAWSSDRVVQAAQTCASTTDDFCRRVNDAMARITPLRSLGAGEVDALYARLEVLDKRYGVR